MFTTNILNGQTKINIHWEVIVPILSIILIVVLIRSIISITYSKRLANNIKAKEYKKALHNAIILNKNSWTHTLNDDLTKLTLAMLNLYFDNKQEFLDKISKIKNNQLIMAKYFWEAVFAYSSGDIEKANQLFTEFENSPKPTNKRITDYEKYKNRLLAIRDFCENNNDKSVNALNNIIQDSNFLQGDLIAKLFLSN